MTQREDEHADRPDQPDRSARDGQVSEVQSLQAHDPDTPIAPDQSVGGAPDGESGRPDEGPQGPNARPDWENDPGETDTRTGRR